MTGTAPIVTFEILGVLGVFEVSLQNRQDSKHSKNLEGNLGKRPRFHS